MNEKPVKVGMLLGACLGLGIYIFSALTCRQVEEFGRQLEAVPERVVSAWQVAAVNSNGLVMLGANHAPVPAGPEIRGYNSGDVIDAATYERQPFKEDLIDGTNTVIWSAEHYGSVLCKDGETRSVSFGLCEDGTVIWRIDP